MVKTSSAVSLVLVALVAWGCGGSGEETNAIDEAPVAETPITTPDTLRPGVGPGAPGPPADLTEPGAPGAPGTPGLPEPPAADTS